MGEPSGRDWTQMTPECFGHDAPPHPAVESAVVPAVPDACGTAPLFGDEPPPEHRADHPRRPAEQAHQEALF